MMKRILLVLTMGVSFAPPVFASTDLGNYRPMVCGELPESQIDHTGTQCEYAVVIKQAEQDLIDSAAPASTSTTKAVAAH
jgi:hypothetical protein